MAREILTDALEKFDGQNIDGHIYMEHLRPPVLAILLETIERENFDGLLVSIFSAIKKLQTCNHIIQQFCTL